jgi:hypothetical protein
VPAVLLKSPLHSVDVTKEESAIDTWDGLKGGSWVRKSTCCRCPLPLLQQWQAAMQWNFLFHHAVWNWRRSANMSVIVKPE